MKDHIIKAIKKIISYPDNSPSKFFFQELTFEYYIDNPSILDDYLCNLYSPEHGLKFFSFRKFFKLPSTFESYIKNMSSFYPDFSIEEDDIVIDVGGHHGIVTVNAAAIGAIVHCFEPNPMSYMILEKNIVKNKFKHRPVINNVAVSSKDSQKMSFDIGIRSTAGSLEKLKDKTLRSGKIIEVDTINLNKYLGKIEHNNIKFLKMDCEGAEYSILENFDNIRRVDYLMIEAHETENNHPIDLIKRLKSLGYTTNKVKANHGALELYCKLKK